MKILVKSCFESRGCSFRKQREFNFWDVLGRITVKLLLYARIWAVEDENKCGERAPRSGRYSKCGGLNIPGIQMWKIWNSINQCRTIRPLSPPIDECVSASLISQSPSSEAAYFLNSDRIFWGGRVSKPETTAVIPLSQNIHLCLFLTLRSTWRWDAALSMWRYTAKAAHSSVHAIFGGQNASLSALK